MSISFRVVLELTDLPIGSDASNKAVRLGIQAFDWFLSNRN